MTFTPISVGLRIRREERRSLKLQTKIFRRRIRNKSEDFYAETENISSLGAYFLTNAPIATGEEVEVRIYLPDFETGQEADVQKTLHLTGFVVRTDAYGLAIAFHEDQEISCEMDSNIIDIDADGNGQFIQPMMEYLYGVLKNQI